MKNKFKISALLAASSVLLFSGCATMFGDNSRDVKIDSTPSQAEIYIDGVKRGKTPAMVRLPDYIYGGKQVILKKNGYEDQVIMVRAAFAPVTLWNLLNGWGFLIDAITGDIVKIDPSCTLLYVDLNKSEPNSK